MSLSTQYSRDFRGFEEGTDLLLESIPSLGQNKEGVTVLDIHRKTHIHKDRISERLEKLVEEGIVKEIPSKHGFSRYCRRE